MAVSRRAFDLTLATLDRNDVYSTNNEKLDFSTWNDISTNMDRVDDDDLFLNPIRTGLWFQTIQFLDMWHVFVKPMDR